MTTTATTVQFGPRAVMLEGPVLGTMRSCNELRDDPIALRQRMAEDGYLLMRNLLPRADVLAARQAVFGEFASQGAFDPRFPMMEGKINPDSPNHGAFLGGGDPTRLPAFRAVVEGASVMEFFAGFLGTPAITFDYKWMRLVGHGDATGAHMDNVYMGRGSSNLYTMWTPLGDVPFAHGPLAVLVGSHRLPSFARVRETYGQMDVDRDRVAGWFSDDPVEVVDRFGGRWATSEFAAGDALIFGMYTMHASLTNVSDQYRITADTRYQPAHEPADERWIGATPKAHYAWHSGPQVAMDAKRREWGV